MTINDRIKVIRREFQLSNIDFANTLGISRQYANNLVSNGTSVGDTIIERILNAFPDINPVWLKMGESSMLLSEKKEIIKDNLVDLPIKRDSRFIRYWMDVDVTGGGVVLFDDTLSDNYEDMLIPDFNDCTDAVNLYGDSMSPRYNSGQTIILKEWTDSFIAYGQVYLVITKSGFRTVKYLRKGSKDNEVLCVSENKNYDPFLVNRDDIHKLYLVKGAIEKTTL